MLLRRVADYLRSCPRAVQVFKWSSAPVGISVYTDSDWASCEATRRSRSGGSIFVGPHVVLTYCRTQDSIALSSAEAELKATCKGLTEALGIREVTEFLMSSENVPIEHYTDASACLGILKRRGAGPVKHLAVKQLWVQEVMTRPGTTCVKVGRSLNPADMLCSIPSGEVLSRHLTMMSFTRPWP